MGSEAIMVFVAGVRTGHAVGSAVSTGCTLVAAFGSTLGESVRGKAALIAGRAQK